MCASNVADLVELDSFVESRWDISGFVNFVRLNKELGYDDWSIHILKDIFCF
jgi:hypothetical protein